MDNDNDLFFINVENPQVGWEPHFKLASALIAEAIAFNSVPDEWELSDIRQLVELQTQDYNPHTHDWLFDKNDIVEENTQIVNEILREMIADQDVYSTLMAYNVRDAWVGGTTDDRAVINVLVAKGGMNVEPWVRMPKRLP